MAKKGQASEDRAGLDNADTGRESVDGSELETGDDDIGAMVAAELGVPVSGGSKRRAAPKDTADDVAAEDVEAADDADDEDGADAAEAAEDEAEPDESGDADESESDEEDAESKGGLPKWVSERLARQERKHREELERVQREMGERVRSLESKLAADGGDGKVADKAGDRSGKDAAGGGDVVAQARSVEDLRAVKSRYEELADWALENLDGVEDFEYEDPKTGKVTKRDFSAVEVRRILADANRKLRRIPERAAELQREAQMAAEAAKHIEVAKSKYPDLFEQGSDAQKLVVRELGPAVIEALKGNPRGALILGEFVDGYRRANGGASVAAEKRPGKAAEREAEDALDGVMQKSSGARDAGGGGAPRTGGGVAAGVGNPGARRASREALRAQDGSEDAIAAAILSGL